MSNLNFLCFSFGLFFRSQIFIFYFSGACTENYILHKYQILKCINITMNYFDTVICTIINILWPHCDQHKPFQLDQYLDCSLCRCVYSFQRCHVRVANCLIWRASMKWICGKIPQNWNAWPVTSTAIDEQFHTLCALLSPQESVALRICCDVTCTCTGVPGPPGLPGKAGQKVRDPQCVDLHHFSCFVHLHWICSHWAWHIIKG